MVKSIKVNLINEFSEVQNENDIIILTSFKFDAPIFDIFLIDKIVEKNPSAEVFVLIDGNEYLKNYESFTKRTGRAYNLIPVFSHNGVFHPKLSIFYSESKKKIFTYIGSSNLTLAGLTSNAELITKVESGLDPVDSTAKDSIDYFNLLIRGKIILNTKFEKAIEEISKTLKNRVENTNVKVIHNLERPILSQVFERIEFPQEITMLAPFWSPNVSVIQEINTKKNLKKIDILIQENNHNLINSELYVKYCKDNEIDINFFNAKFEDKRIFHSKIISMSSKDSYSLVGSPNLTESALLRTYKEGNFEFSALIKGDINEIIEEIKTEKIDDFHSIKNNKIEFESISSILTIPVFDIDFDMINQILSLIIPPTDIETFITVIYEDKTKEEFKISGKNKFELHCKKIPFEIELKQENRMAKRRIFYDENYLYKRISRGNISISEINKKISTDYNINVMDILRVFSSINLTVEKERVFTKRTESKNKEEEEEERFSMPSREIDSYYNKRIINNFIDLYKIINSRKEEEREIEQSGEIEEIPLKKGYNQFQKVLEEDTEKKKICLKLLKSVNDLLIFKSNLETNPEEALLASSSLTIQLILKISSQIGAHQEILIDLINKLNENLEGIKINNINPETRKNLFFNFVLMGYFFKYEDSFNYELYKRKFYINFINKILSNDEVTNPEFIQQCYDYVKNNMSGLRPQEIISNEEIAKYGGHLSSLIPHDDVSKDLFNYLNIIKNSSNGLEWLWAKYYLENLLTNWGHDYYKEKIMELIKDYPVDKKKYIQNLLKD